MNWETSRRTFQAALIWIGAAALAFGLWRVRQSLLLAFGAILAAILLRVIATQIARWARLSERFALAIAVAVVLGVIGVTLWLFGSQMSSEFNQLIDNVQAGERSFEAELKNGGFGPLGPNFAESGTSFLTSSISGVLSGGLRFAEAAIVLAISAIYLAAEPQLYHHGFAKLFPRHVRGRAVASIDLIGRTLRLWLLGQFILMLLVGVLSFAVCWLIGLPDPIALGLIAGIAEIIPYLGPFISAVPALLVALTQGVSLVVWTAAAYLAIHLFEGYIVAPLVERRFVTIPPALILLGIVVCSFLFGTMGVILAAPLTVAGFMAVKMVYVDDPLEEHIDEAAHSG